MRAAIGAEQLPLSLPWALALGAGVTSLVALTVAAQIYLSMLQHGHSFIRIEGSHSAAQVTCVLKARLT